MVALFVVNNLFPHCKLSNKKTVLWYRIWSDGWIEQGGERSWDGDWSMMNLIKAFKTTTYLFVATGYRTTSSPYQGFCCAKDWSTSQVNMWFSDDNTHNKGMVRWYACGY